MTVEAYAKIVTQDDFDKTILIKSPKDLMAMMAKIFNLPSGTALMLGHGDVNLVGKVVSLSIDRLIYLLPLPAAETTVAALRETIKTATAADEEERLVLTEATELANSIDSLIRLARQESLQ